MSCSWPGTPRPSDWIEQNARRRLWREGVLDLVALGDDFGRLRLAVDGAGDRFLGGAIVEVVDLLVVVRFPVDEHADADEEIVGFLHRDHTFRDAVSHRLADGVLRRS